LNKPEFTQELMWLAQQYEKDTTKLMEPLWDELKAYDARDWAEAVRVIARDSNQRAWPRLGVILNHIFDAAMRRQDREWAATKQQEINETVQLMTQEARNDGQRRSRAVITAVAEQDPEKRKAAFKVVEEEFRDAQIDAPAHDSGCSCENGLVFVKIRRPQWDDTVTCLGRCGLCPAGKQQPRSLPSLDPISGATL
jgi:hypothetical protein